ncbi:hypothetical protein ACIGBH_38910 [Streptomyces sp. NPDC085929]|uniref:hypothetical protein n=1 Tax=Streptomyces sp. NPDC085929 TaxID=3365739 RepID=UPI0037D1DF21
MNDLAGLRQLLALAFHQAVQTSRASTTTSVADADHASCAEIAAFMADLPLSVGSGALWVSGEEHTRQQWHGLVLARWP